MKPEIVPLRAFADNYIWFITRSGNSHAVVVDPGDAQPVIEALTERNLSLAAILITHGHGDHTGGLRQLLEVAPVPVFGPAGANIRGVSHPLHDQAKITIEALGLCFEALEVSGHTQHDIAYFGHGALFCGDTLFTAGSGRLFAGPAEKMFASLSKLRALPEQTLVYCAHEYTQQNLQFACQVEPDNAALQARQVTTERLRATDLPTVPATLQLEKATNPFLRWDVPQVKAAAERFAASALTLPQVYATLRQWKDSLD